MKKLLVTIAVVVMLCGGISAKETELPQLTDKQKFTQQVQGLTQKRQQYLQAVQQVEIEIIKLQAVLQYIASVEKKELTKKK